MFSLVVIDIIILVVYTAVEGATYYPDGMTGLEARKVVNSEYSQSIDGVSHIATMLLSFVTLYM